MWFLLFSITYHINTQCPFYYVPDYDSYTAQEACSRQDFKALQNSSMVQGRLDYMGRTDCKIPADAGFVCDTAAVTTTVLRDAIKLTPCICFCFWKSLKPCHFNSNKSPTWCSNFFSLLYWRLIYSSTCFGRFPAHHQKLNNCSVSLWFYLRIVVIVVLCSWSGHHGTKVKPEAATAVIELLMIGGKTPETCSAVRIINWKISASGWRFIWIVRWCTDLQTLNLKLAVWTLGFMWLRF